ncbi:MAG: type 1 glutamine amidotransferase domain-containing protein [Xanthomonadales bacterium]|nr:type 1 glutamine amidotransferase domain-containing protein [Xanthomonadales bacterium]ODU93550.1 MAG: dimethylallyltransferase [Rhodanobacter sp. SCN 66-43]OJY86647.1 MAG: type 1 glutamine amidotransferase domain-containing protein [Xanthomonadales bacterium 66-474]
MKILMVLTSHGQLGETGKATGLWLEELAAPYYVFKDAGADITLASPAGGQPPVDPNSEQSNSQTEATRRFRADSAAMQALAHTHKLAEIDREAFDAVFYPGGHGPLWDLAGNEDSRLLIDAVYAAGKPVAAVCHGVAALRDALGPFGLPLVRGKAVTGFSDSEEKAAGLADAVPFLVEDMLKENGGEYSRAADWQAHVVVSGNLITGQNPASSTAAAEAVLQQLRGTAKAV